MQRRSTARARTRLGRYLVIDEVGRGGMGVVLRAYDPRLSREVALKIRRAPAITEHDRQRLLREARAMAQLAHPNVVAVYDVERSGNRLLLAMEYVRGRTLRQWLTERSPDWNTIVEAIVEAGRGLSAAHEVGLIHRDFKPGNVLVGDDGRVRVTDFGLAKIDEDADAAETPLSSLDTMVVAGDLTRASIVVGTPRYMAPEQHDGEELTPAVDQYALCVTLWEALTGSPPFAGSELAAAKRRGPPGWPSGASVPSSIVSAIRRGLSPSPSERWSSLEALSNALTRARGQRRRRHVGASVLAVGMGVATAVGWNAWAERQRIAACEATQAELEWDDTTRAAIAAGLLESGAPHATTTADKVMPWLDDYAARWRTARVETCLDSTVRDRWDAHTTARARWCLEGRRLELASVIDELRNADAEKVSSAVSTAATLRRIEPCRDAALLSRLPAPPTEQRGTIDAIRAELSRARALLSAGDYPQSLKAARRAMRDATKVGWPPLIAAAELELGRALGGDGESESARQMLERAYFDARVGGALEEALGAADSLAYTAGYELAQPEVGVRWVRHADTLRSILGDPSGVREASGLGTLATILGSTGEYKKAADLQAKALALREAALGPNHPQVAESLANLAATYSLTGELDRGAELLERSLAIREAAFGPEHPVVASSLGSLAIVERSRGDFERAESLDARALKTREAILGADHPDVAVSLNGLANTLRARGEHRRSRQLLTRALAIKSKALGPDHPSLGQTLANVATSHRLLGEYDQAAALLDRALAIQERAQGPDHPSVGLVLTNLASVRRAMGEYEAAFELQGRALKIHQAAFGAAHPRVAANLANQGIVRRTQGRHAEATVLLQRAIAIYEAALGEDHPNLAVLLSNLGFTMLARGDNDEARATFERALAIFERGFPDHRSVGGALEGLAQVALAEGQPERALVFAERCVAAREAGEGAPELLANAHLTLARALVATDGSRVRAASLARRARAAFSSAGPGNRGALEEAEAFLREHEPTP